MKTILNKSGLAIFGASLVLLLLVCFTLSPQSKACPLVQLSSPPSSIAICSSTCSGTNICNRSCQNTLTLNASTCSPFVWHFHDVTSGCNTTFTSSGPSLSFTLRGSVGDTIELTIDNCCGGSSVTYTFSTFSC